MPSFMFDKTGVVVGAIGANCGATWLARGKWSCIKNTLRFWATDPSLSTEFLFHSTNNSHLWPKRGSAQPFIAQTDARNMNVLVPNEGLARFLGEVVRPFYDKIGLSTSQIRNISDVRDTLLPRLISGKLRVPEAEKLAEAII